MWWVGQRSYYSHPSIGKSVGDFCPSGKLKLTKALKTEPFRTSNIFGIAFMVFHCSKYLCTDEDLQNKMHYAACGKSTTML